MDWHYLSMFFGYFAMGCYLLAPLFKAPRKSIFTVQFGDIANLIVYLSHLQFGGAITLFLSIVRGGAALSVSDEVLRKIVIANIVILWAIFLYRLSFPYDLLLGVAATCIAFAQYFRDHFWKYRGFVVVSQVMWIIHSLLTGMDVMALTCVLIACLTVGSGIYYQISLRRQPVVV